MTAKLRRVSQACDNCSQRRVRCQPSDTDNPKKCQHCVDFGEDCTYNRPQRKRGARKGRRVSAHSVNSSSINNNDPALRSPSSATSTNRPESASAIGSNDRVSNASSSSKSMAMGWSPPLHIEQALAIDLVEVYFECVYPIFPFFHRAYLLRRVARGEHMLNRPFYACVMALCALSSARARDGATYSQRWKRSSSLSNGPRSEAIFDAARSALEINPTSHVSLDYMRATVLLSIAAIQYGNERLMHFFIGIYHTYVAVEGLHDEANWPPNLSPIETQERRRLFWSAYTLDVFSSIVWNGTLRSREASANVRYPEAIEDETPPERSEGRHSDDRARSRPAKVPWMYGWNFVTEMYRILEHAVDHLRHTQTPHRRSTAVLDIIDTNALSQGQVIPRVIAMYDNLPREFKIISPIAYDLEQDLYGFQAANIAATVQLLRMVYFTNDNATLEERCTVAGEVIKAFCSVPAAYLRASSSPLQHHLAEIGSMLGGAFKNSMTETNYRNVRLVLLDLARLLESLETDLFCPTGTGAKLRRQVAAADEFMAAERSAGIIQQQQQQQQQRYSSHQQQHQPPIMIRPTFTGPPQPTCSPYNPSVQAPPIPILNEQDSPQYQFPPELFEDWSWALDITPERQAL